MFVLRCRNVNDAFAKGHNLLRDYAFVENSRAGMVYVLPEPCTTVYNEPTECVLFDAQRDANPFFHLAEAFWMLGGSRDARWLDNFIKDFSARFAEPNGDMYGAYGYRWRTHWLKNDTYFDQIQEVVELLKIEPTTRRAVIQMWDPVADLGGTKKDHPCNLTIAFRARKGGSLRYTLDMTVFCRSNDMIWGAYGANAVHFSFLLQYIATACGWNVGIYNQVSNNFHAYADVYDELGNSIRIDDLYQYTKPVRHVPLLNDTERLWMLNTDISKFIGYNSAMEDVRAYETQFFKEVVHPMFLAFKYWKDNPALDARKFTRAWARDNMDPGIDWHCAALRWMERRINKQEENAK